MEHATVTLEIASVSALGGLEGAFWQPDGHGSLWQADGSPDPTAAGYGEWLPDITSDPHKDWESLPWWPVECDQQVISTTTGFAPYEWNADPGTMSVTLWDPKVIYSPIGPVGLLDDIGIDTPIRVKVTGPGKPWTAARPFTILWAGLIRRVVHSITVDGQQVTTINASEAIEIYGRVNPVALTVPAPMQDLKGRTLAIHNRSDKPASIPDPDTSANLRTEGQGTQFHPADDLHDNVWQEMAHAINVHGLVAGQLLYPYTMQTTGAADPPIVGTPRATAIDPIYRTTDGWYPIAKNVQVRPYCTAETAPGPTYAISPTSLIVTHSLDGVANLVDLAVAGWANSAKSYSDQVSRDRWGTHTYTRHDLKLVQDATFRDQLGADILARVKQAVYSVEGLEFPVTNERDLTCLVGAPVYAYAIADPGNTYKQWLRANGSVCCPGEWWPLHWSNPSLTAWLLICSVAHNITPTSWTVTVGAEIAGLNDPAYVTWPTPVPKALELEAA